MGTYLEGAQLSPVNFWSQNLLMCYVIKFWSDLFHNDKKLQRNTFKVTKIAHICFLFSCS